MKIVRKRRKKEYTINLPYSKSISNRLLVIRSLANSQEEIINLSDSDDTRILENAIQVIESERDFPFKATNQMDFHCRNAGTTTRFLIALLSIEGEWIIDADDRMNERPILPLINALRLLGADIRTNDKKNIFPLTIIGKQLSANKPIIFEDNLTSQIVSALILISPRIKGLMKIVLPENQVSSPYIKMTIALARQFGAIIEEGDNYIICNESQYKFHKTEVEIDYSALCFVYCFVCVGKRKNVRVNKLKTSTLQGDSIAGELFRHLGLEISEDEDFSILSYSEELAKQNEELSFDLKDTPDIFPALATAAYVSGKETVIKNLASLRVKESNRLESMMNELNKMGERCFIEENAFHIKAGKFNVKSNLSFNCYDDHRIAMALSSIALVCKEVEIDNHYCVSKSWKSFWKEMSDFIVLEQPRN